MKIVDLLQNFLRAYNQFKELNGYQTQSNAIDFLETRHTILNIENQLHLLNSNLYNEVNADNIAPLLQLLNLRWKLIRGTDLAYPYALEHPINSIYLTLAEDIGQALGQSPYKLLMPTLISFNDAITDEIQNESLDHYILTDDDSQLLNVLSTLEFAEEDGILKKYNPAINLVEPLSHTEKYRLTRGSTAAANYYSTISALIEFQKSNGSIGSIIKYLADHLNDGGVHSGNDGTEENAGHDANVGIVFFSELLPILTPAEKHALLELPIPNANNETVGDLWNRICDPAKKRDENGELDVRYCVEIIESKLITLLKTKPELFDLIPKNIKNNKPLQIKKLLNNVKQARAQLPAPTTHKPTAARKIFLSNLLAEHVVADDARIHATHLVNLPNMLAIDDHTQLRIELLKFPEAYRFSALKIIGTEAIKQIINSSLKFDLLLALFPIAEHADLLIFFSVERATEIMKNGYNLSDFISQLKSEKLALLLEFFGENLKTVVSDKPQFFHVIANLSPDGADHFIQALGMKHIRKLIRCGNDIYSLMEKRLELAELSKLSAIFKNRNMQDVVEDFLENYLAQLPEHSQRRIIGLIGANYVLRLCKTPEQFKHLIFHLSDVEKAKLVTDTSSDQLQKIFISEQGEEKSQPKLKTVVKNIVTKIDLFQDVPNLYQRLVRETASFYAKERAKASCLGIFSSKTKAVMALNEFAQHGLDLEVAKAHSKQFSRNNEVGALYRRLTS
jgi:hypothetical protein